MDREGRNLDKEEIPGSSQSMQGYILTYPGFKGRTFVISGFSTEGIFISAICSTYCGRKRRKGWGDRGDGDGGGGALWGGGVGGVLRSGGSRNALKGNHCQSLIII